MRKVPCKYCDKDTFCIDTELCNNCWEVDRRIDAFVKAPKARQRLYMAMREYKND